MLYLVEAAQSPFNPAEGPTFKVLIFSWTQNIFKVLWILWQIKLTENISLNCQILVDICVSISSQSPVTEFSKQREIREANIIS
jgi:hypothetical protein